MRTLASRLSWQWNNPRWSFLVVAHSMFIGLRPSHGMVIEEVLGRGKLAYKASGRLDLHVVCCIGAFPPRTTPSRREVGLRSARPVSFYAQSTDALGFAKSSSPCTPGITHLIRSLVFRESNIYRLLSFTFTKSTYVETYLCKCGISVQPVSIGYQKDTF
jgi:hypothetical protein